MRVLVRSRRESERLGLGNDTIEVVNAETGEQIQGITSLVFSATSDSLHNKLILEIVGVDVDLEEEAQVVSGKDVVQRRDNEVGCEGVDYS